jgi:signal transduction histidine kinase
VRKHAGATAVAVTLSYRDSAAELTVRDDGRGFAPGAVPATGYGLSGMRGRLGQIGGQLVVHSGPGGGTVVTATVPA